MQLTISYLKLTVKKVNQKQVITTELLSYFTKLYIEI